MVNRIGRSSIAALELGNEPELYGTFGWYRSAAGNPVPGRPHDYDPAAFARDYSAFSPRLPSVELAGPSSGAAPWLAKLGSFLDAEPRVGLVTVHAYPLKHCTASKVITAGQASLRAVQPRAGRLAGALRRRRPVRTTIRYAWTR